MRRRWARWAGASAAAAGVLGGLVLGGAFDQLPSGPMTDGDLCRALEGVDVAGALAGDNEVAQAQVVSLLADIGERAPEDVRPAVEAIAELAAGEPVVGEVADRDPDDPAVSVAASQLAYRLQFSQLYRDAAARIERFAVERCGATPSGRFDLDVPWTLDDTPRIDLDLEGFDPPQPEIDAALYEPFELPEVAPPTVEIRPSDPKRFQLQPYEIVDVVIEPGEP